MNDDRYLWDRSGPPDPEVERLERVLAPLAYKPRKRRVHGWVWPASIAAAIALIAGSVWYSFQPHGPSWQVVAMAGKHHQQRVSKGGAISTDADSRVRLELNSFGRVDVEPNTRLQLLVAKADEQRMALARGKIHAVIWAPPHQFYVNTPSSVAVDLGCAYSLEVDEGGDSTVRVEIGWVAFEDHGKESFVPAGALCMTRPGAGPGIPRYEDAPSELAAALTRFDSGADPSAIADILHNARARDAVSLWHLLRRVRPEDRGRVYDRMTEFIQVPAAISRDAILRGDEAATDALWDTLGLGDTAWWRTWKR